MAEISLSYDRKMQEEVDKLRHDLRSQFESELEQQTDDFQQRMLG